MSQTISLGCFFAVVGPSGSGKDSLIDGARSALPSSTFVFAKRVITRPPGQVGEDYESCTTSDFLKRQQQGNFIITWQAHDLHYGLPRALVDEQKLGKHIVANCSRQAIAGLQKQVDNLVVLHIHASETTLANRLRLRGRETDEQIKHRLKRKSRPLPKNVTVVDIDNNGTLEEGRRQFVAAIEAFT